MRFAVVGLLVALGVDCFWLLLAGPIMHTDVSLVFFHYVEQIQRVIDPTLYFDRNFTETHRGPFFVFGVTTVANALLYGLVGLCIGAVWKLGHGRIANQKSM